MSYLKQFGELGRDDVEIAGGKAANLGELTRAGFPVPHGFVVSTDGYREFVAARGIGAAILDLAGSGGTEQASAAIEALFSGDMPDDLRSEITDGYAALGADVPVAVRSSATAEDLAEASFAGQQDTYLNIRGTEAVIAAITRCWGSLWTERAMTYRARQGIAPETVSLAVVVQQMVEADAAGVMFTANPANGRRDELVISAAWGLGEAVVSGQVNTDDLVLDKRRSVINSRQTAEKMIMTSYADLGTAEGPVPEDRRRAAVLSDDDAKALAALGIRIEQHYGSPQDIEWARSGAELFILQARPITALPDAEAPMPTDWTVPAPTDMYVRASIVEQLPDPLTPLFAEMIDGSVTRSLGKLMNELLVADVVRDGDVGLPTVNGYAYYRYTRSGMGRILLRMWPAFRVLSTNSERGGLARWRDYSHPRYQAAVADWTARPVEQLDDHELLDGVAALLDAGTEYYTSVQTIIPIAAMAEIIFSAYYDRLVRRPGDPAASTFLLGFESEPIRAEQSLYDLAAWTREHTGLTETILSRRAAEVLDPATGGDDPDWAEWQSRFHDHLARFGHAVYNLDFANAVPADAPAPLLDTLRFYLRGQGADPADRRRRSAERREKTAAEVAARLDPVRRTTFERLLRRAQVVAPAREDALADVGLAWPQLRRMLLELGQRLVDRGSISRPEDIFWLHRAEIADPTPDLIEQVERRRELWRGQRRATPPQLLPKGGALVESMRRWLPASSEDQVGDVIKGTAASAGVVTASARVLSGPEDFGSMVPGEVLVASITTPAWTSLFAMAAAVVTDIGGPLSHSSIVAREYGIPAVLGTAVATRRIHSGQRIRVDGDAGTVTLLDADDQGPETTAEADRPSAGRRLLPLAGVAAAGVAVAMLIRRRARRR